MKVFINGQWYTIESFLRPDVNQEPITLDFYMGGYCDYPHSPKKKNTIPQSAGNKIKPKITL